MKRKIRAIFLIMTLISMLLIVMACNNPEKGSNSDNAKNGGGDANSSDGDKSTQSEFIPAKADYDNYEFRFLDFIAFGDDWMALRYLEIDPETSESEPINDALFEKNAKVEELYKVSIKEVRHGEKTDDYNGTTDKTIRLFKAGEDNFDVAFFPGTALSKLFAEPNIAYDLSKIPELDLSNSWWNQGCVEAFTLGGKLFTVTGDITIWNSLSTTVFYFNKKLLEDLSLEDPYALVRENKWTWDKMGEMAKDASKDLNGDSKIDRFDQLGIASEDGTMAQAVLCAGESITYKDENGMPVLNQNLEKISSIIDKVMPILRDDTAAYATSDLYGKMQGNPYFAFTMPKFRDNQTLFYTQQLMVALNLREMEADFGVLPFPKYDEKQSNYWSFGTDFFMKYIWIPTTNTETGRTANIIQAMAYYSQQLVIPAVYDVTITNKALRDEESLEMLELINRNRVYDLATIYNWADVLGVYGNIYNKKTNNLSSAYESRLTRVETEMQKTIDQLES